MKILGLIPAFNSEATIARVVRETRRYIDHVLVIDDGSTDRTARRAKESGARLIRVSQNRGKGNALKIGFHYGLTRNFDAVITLDADLQHDPSDIPKFLHQYRQTHSVLIVGNRLGKKEKIPRIRYAANRIGTYCFSWLINQSVEDSQCGFRLYDRQMIENIFILNDGFEAEADILLRAGKRGYTITFVPVKTIYFPGKRYQSFYRPVYDTFRICIIFLRNLFWKNR